MTEEANDETWVKSELVATEPFPPPSTDVHVADYTDVDKLPPHVQEAIKTSCMSFPIYPEAYKRKTKELYDEGKLDDLRVLQLAFRRGNAYPMTLPFRNPGTGQTRQVPIGLSVGFVADGFSDPLLRRFVIAVLQNAYFNPEDPVLTGLPFYFLPYDPNLRAWDSDAALVDTRAEYDEWLQLRTTAQRRTRAPAIRISFNPQQGAFAFVGRGLRRVTPDRVTMNLGFLTLPYGGTVIHEFNHSLGMVHEHQRGDVQGRIPWNREAVYAYFGNPPNNWPPEIIRDNIFEAEPIDDSNSSEPDPFSIMMYQFDCNLFTREPFPPVPCSGRPRVWRRSANLPLYWPMPVRLSYVDEYVLRNLYRAPGVAFRPIPDWAYRRAPPLPPRDLPGFSREDGRRLWALEQQRLWGRQLQPYPERDDEIEEVNVIPPLPPATGGGGGVATGGGRGGGAQGDRPTVLVPRRKNNGNGSTSPAQTTANEQEAEMAAYLVAYGMPRKTVIALSVAGGIVGLALLIIIVYFAVQASKANHRNRQQR